MRRLFFWAAVAGACLCGAVVCAAIPADALLAKLQPQGAVNDFAAILNPAERSALEERVGELRRKTGAQFAVVTLKSLDGGQIDDFANKLFKKWGVGQQRKNNGVMLLVALQDRKARVEVGYGLEPILPDALAGRVLDEQLFPAFKQQRYAQGLRLAVNRIAEIIERGEPAAPEARQGKARPPSQVNPVFFTLFLSIFVAIGFAVIGAGVATRRVVAGVGAGFWGLLFGGVPLFMVWLESWLGFFTLVPVAAVMFFLGWKAARSATPKKSAAKGWHSGWTWGAFDWSSRGSSGGGGGWSSGGFGGGSSGGGGASGGW